MLSAALTTAGNISPPVGYALPIITNTSTLSYLCLVALDGTFIKAISLGVKIFGRNISYQRYGQFFYLFSTSASGNNRIDKVNVRSGTVSTISTFIPCEFTFWGRISPTLAMNVGTTASTYNVMDLTTGTITTTTGYTAATTTSGAGSNAFVSFYTRGDTTVSDFQERVFWASPQSFSGSFPSEVNTALFSSGTLAPRTIVLSNGPNLSRQWGAVGDTATAAVVLFDSNIYKVDRAAATAAQWILSSTGISYGGATYFPTGIVSPRASALLTSNLRFYWQQVSSATSPYKWIITSFDFTASSNTQTPVRVFDLPQRNDSVSVTCAQVNAAGDTAFLYHNSPTAANELTLVLVSGTTVNNTYTITVPSGVATEDAQCFSVPTSEFTV